MQDSNQETKLCVNCFYYDKRNCIVFDSEVPPFTSCPKHVFHDKIKVIFDFQSQKYHLYNDSNEVIYTDNQYSRIVKQHNLLNNQKIGTELNQESLNSHLSQQEWDDLSNITPEDISQALSDWSDNAPSDFKSILKTEAINNE